MKAPRKIHLGWLTAAIVADVLALVSWNVTFTSCAEAISGASECTTSPEPRIFAGLLVILSVGFVLKAVTSHRGGPDE